MSEIEMKEWEDYAKELEIKWEESLGENAIDGETEWYGSDSYPCGCCTCCGCSCDDDLWYDNVDYEEED